MARVSDSRPPLATQYAVNARMPNLAEPDEMLMMEPCPALSMCGAESWLMMKADVTHQSKVCRKSSSVTSKNRRLDILNRANNIRLGARRTDHRGARFRQHDRLVYDTMFADVDEPVRIRHHGSA